MSEWTRRMEDLERRLAAVEGRPVFEQYPAVIRKDVELAKTAIDRALTDVVHVELGTISYEDPLTQSAADLLYDPVGAAAAAMPPGVILPYGGSSAPTGFLLCDGSAVSRATYAALFAVVGTTYGIGDGSTTFNVPDTRGNVLVGFKAADADFGTLGGTAGAKTQTAAGSVSAPVFTGSALSTHTHGAGSYTTSSDSAGTPSGTNSTPTFTGAPGTTTSNSGSAVAIGAGSNDAAPTPHTHDFTPSGSVSAPAFTGAALAAHAHTISGTSAATSAGTPAGTNSAPTFTGSPTSVLQPSLTISHIVKT